MKNSKYIIIFFIFSNMIFSQGVKTFFKSPEGKFFISSDLHIHTVFSDGLVWPTIRVDEAIRDSIDLISLTEHIEYQSHIVDIPHPNRNRSFQIASGYVQKQPLAVVHGTEITKGMPPGHYNAIFVNDVNKFFDSDKKPKEFMDAIKEANNQDAFVFWNHPHWEAQRSDGIARLDPIHKEIIKKKYLHGIEVVNMFTFSEEAMQIALENNLTMIGTSDVHVLIDWDFKNERESYHRPLTFIIAENRTIKATSDALFQGKTFVWFHDLIIGKEENLYDVASENLSVISEGYNSGGMFSAEKLLKVKLINHSVAPIQLKYLGEFTFHSNFNFIELAPKSEKEVYIKTKNILTTLDLPFEILNYVIAPKTNLKINKKINIE